MNSSTTFARCSVKEPLNLLLSNAGLQTLANTAFTDWPTLERVAAAFIHFVTPWMMIGTKNLAEETLRGALEAYEKHSRINIEGGHRSFIERVAESAQTLAAIRVSVMDKDGLWSVWQYDQPLMDYLSQHKRCSIQVRERETSIPVGPVMIKLLAAISTTREMQMADLDIPRLLVART